MVLVASFGVVGYVGSSPASAATPDVDRVESSVTTSTNQKRTQWDRRFVRGNACLDRMAEAGPGTWRKTNTLTHRRMGTILSQCDRSTSATAPSTPCRRA